MLYIIPGSIIIFGIVAMIISYIYTPDTVPNRLSSKLVDYDISVKDAMDELKLVNESIIIGDNK